MTINMHNHQSAAQSGQPVRWSNAQQWLGYKPSNGDDVVIPEGLAVILDQDTPDLGTLSVDGQLIFDEKDLTLTADNLIVNGELWVGTEDKPFTYDAQIVLTGKESDADIVTADLIKSRHSEEHSDHGNLHIGTTIENKALIVSGKIELHGAKVQSWTQLNGTVQAGATSLTLAENVQGWNVGDRIAIAPTDFDPFEVEEVTITAISGRTISFDQPLRYLHYGEQETLPDGRLLDMRAEVTNLSRNITISGQDEGEIYTSGSGKDFQRWGYGGHTMYLTGSEVRIDGVEFKGLGLSGNPGRYPIHFHHGGQMDGSYIKNSAIHHTLQRGIVVHQTEQLLIEGNVVYDTIGHQFYLEDSVEVDNKFYNNLGILPRTTPQEFRLDTEIKAPDGEDPLKRHDRASVFWITNGANEFVGNHAVAVPRGQGFWFASPDVDIRARGINPYDERRQRPTQTFADNTAHTIMFDQRGGMNLAYGPEWTGLALDIENIRADYNGRYQGIPNAPIENFTAYKTGNIAINAGSFGSEIINPILAEARALLHVPQGQNGSPVQIINPALIGETENNPADRDIDTYIQELISRGGFAGPIVADPLGSRGFDIVGGFISDRDEFQSLLGTKEKHFRKVSFLPDSSGKTALDFVDSVPVQPAPIEPLTLPAPEPDLESPQPEPPVTEPPVTEPPVTEPPVTEPPSPEPPTTESPTTEPPVTISANSQFLDGTLSPQQWNSTVSVSGRSSNGQAAVVKFGWDGLAVRGDRYDNQIDYDLATGQSEQLILDFETSVVQTTIELGRMSFSEWQGLPETGAWQAYDKQGRLVGSGTLDPRSAARTGKDSFQFNIQPASSFAQLVIEATAYGNGSITARSDNNSDFNLKQITYTTLKTTASASSVVEEPVPSSPPAPPVIEEPTALAQLVKGDPVTLQAATLQKGATGSQAWGDNVTVTGYDTNGAIARVGNGWDGLSVTSGRYRRQLDYDAQTNSSEQLVLNFNGPVTSVNVELGRMSISEWNNLPETGQWTAYDADGNPVATGELDPRSAISVGSSSYRFDLDSPVAFEKLVIEATAYGNGAGINKTGNNSDFNLKNVTYKRIQPASSVAPVSPPPFAPPAFSAPTSTNRITLLASANVLNGSESPQSWGEGVEISALDFDGAPATVAYDTQFKDHGFGVANADDRWNQIDFYAEKGNQSEKLRLDFSSAVDNLEITVGMLGAGEGNGFDETGYWTAFNVNDEIIRTGLIGPELSTLGAGSKVPGSYGEYPIEIDASVPIAALLIEATGFGHGQGEPTQRSYGENNSDFNLMAISFDPVVASSEPLKI